MLHAQKDILTCQNFCWGWRPNRYASGNIEHTEAELVSLEDQYNLKRKERLRFWFKLKTTPPKNRYLKKHRVFDWSELEEYKSACPTLSLRSKRGNSLPRLTPEKRSRQNSEFLEMERYRKFPLIRSATVWASYQLSISTSALLQWSFIAKV